MRYFCGNMVELKIFVYEHEYRHREKVWENPFLLIS